MLSNSRRLLAKHYQGGCLCGSVKYTVEGPPEWVAVNHSSFYRMSHGAMSVPVGGVLPKNFLVEEGEGYLHRKAFESVYKHTCKKCGTHVYDDWLTHHKKIIFPPQLHCLGKAHKRTADWEALHPQFHIHYNSAVCHTSLSSLPSAPVAAHSLYPHSHPYSFSRRTMDSPNSPPSPSIGGEAPVSCCPRTSLNSSSIRTRAATPIVVQRTTYQTSRTSSTRRAVKAALLNSDAPLRDANHLSLLRQQTPEHSLRFSTQRVSLRYPLCRLAAPTLPSHLVLMTACVLAVFASVTQHSAPGVPPKLFKTMDSAALPPADRSTEGAASFIDCVLVIDAVHDFLSESGKFAEAYGQEDTAPLRAVASELDTLVAEARKKNVEVIAVSSHYKPTQFRKAVGVCSTPEGSRVVLPSADGCKVVYKTGNSVLESGSKVWLLERLSNKRVLVCGVTTPACVDTSAHALKGKCAGVYVAEDAVAARASTSAAVDEVFQKMKSDETGEISLVSGWRELLERPAPEMLLHYVNGSIPSIRVQLALYHSNVHHKTHRLRVMSVPKPTREPDFLAINPRGQTPVLSEGDIDVRESLAILQYLDATRRTALLPTDPPVLARALAYAQESERLRLRLDGIETFYETPLAAERAGVLSDVRAIVEELKVWDEYAAQNVGGFIAGTASLSVADCAVFPVLSFCVRRGVALTQLGLVSLQKYFTHMLSLSCVRRSTPHGWNTWDPTVRAGNNLWTKAIRFAAQYATENPDAAYVVASLVTPAKVSGRRTKGAARAAVACASATTDNARPSSTSSTDQTPTYEPAVADVIPIEPRVFDPAYFACHGVAKGVPLTDLGSGDTTLALDVLPEALADDAFDRVQREVSWFTMAHKGGAVPRLVAIQGDVIDGIQPVYRHPADEQPKLAGWTPAVLGIKKICEQVSGQSLNHALIQWYRDGGDFISPHADKTLDILRGSCVLNFSLGCTRDMVLTSKKDIPQEKRLKQRIALPHGSLFSLGWDSNLKCLHTIKTDKRPVATKRADEVRDGCNRISITFRTVASFMREDGRIWGQGSPYKTEDKLPATDEGPQAASAPPVCEGAAQDAAPCEVERMLHAFGRENRNSDFDWDEQYGCGFTCMNVNEINDNAGAAAAERPMSS